MPGFQWKREYRLGIESIDAQHKMIMEKFNALYEGITKGADLQTISMLMSGLIEYAQSHFHDEEELFTLNGYPKAEEQKAAHRKFRARAEAIHDAYVNDPTISPLEVVEFLEDWIENHLLTLDMDYKEFTVRLEALKKIR